MQATSRWLRMSQLFSKSPVHSGIADLRHYNAEYCEWGFGEPLVLLPGLAGGIDLIAPLAQRLGEHYHVIAFQSRGETDCFALRRRFNLDDLAADLKEFINWRGLEQPAVMGVSFGAVVACKFAARFPDRLSALALQGLGLRFESGLVQRIADMVLSSYPIPGDCRFVNQFLSLLFGGRPAPEHLEYVAQTCWQTDQSVMSHRLRLLRRLNLRNEASRITVPTLVVAGGKDILVGTKNYHDLAGSLCDSQLVQIDRAGHLATISHSVEIVNSVSDFFSAVKN